MIKNKTIKNTVKEEGKTYCLFKSYRYKMFIWKANIFIQLLENNVN